MYLLGNKSCVEHIRHRVTLRQQLYNWRLLLSEAGIWGGCCACRCKEGLSNMVLRRQLAEVQAARALLRDEIDLREEFTSMAAHELRTPLNTLYLQTQVRRHMPAGASVGDDRNEAMVQRDERMIANMVRLIDDMRDTARMQHGRMPIHPQPMDLAGMVVRVVQGFEAQAAAAGCALTFAVPETLHGYWDDFRLEQVLGNLLTNAIRYGPGSPIHVQLECRPPQAVLSVHDGGRGIAPEDCGRVFERFVRAGDHSTAPGLGLGLYISRQIAQEHGGSLDVRSALGSGSVFSLSLPLSA
ncbi:MAG: HAMP domain-containing histidine kinase [Burkholderiales bacterium]|nr:MAG: HAMP domain-containing histidine kinase [Burkholderiales bacterium]